MDSKRSRQGTDEPAATDQRPQDAIHLVCEECGAVDYGEGLSAELTSQVDASHGFAIRSAEITVFGLCVHCRPD